MKHLWLLLVLFISPVVHAGIGNITELQGTAVDIKRNKTNIAGKQNTDIESMDMVSVGSGTNLGITFKDKTKVKVTANSKLLIDDFVYDPNITDAGKLAMKVTLGTVRYASGQVAKNNPQNVNIKTPTATIAVRGTDFAMTVDEVGRSLVVLLPSCDDQHKLVTHVQLSGNCTIGAIDVETLGGSVALREAYTATYVTDIQQPPLPPVKVDPIAVSNDSNLKKPEMIAQAESDREDKKDREKDKSKFNDDERKKAVESTEKSIANKQAQDGEETRLIGVVTVRDRPQGDPNSNNCWPFNDCGNEKGLNWYYRKDDDRGNTIFIRSGEKYDNTTYNISINNNDVETRINGDGSNKVTVRIWNR